jgi:hypothetical protein
MGILHSFFGESGKFQDHQVVAFCGFGASDTQLKEFDKQWENQLRRCGMDALHWVTARRCGKALGDNIGSQSLRERINDLKPFANCVNDYLGLDAACVFEVTGYTSFAQDSKNLLGGSDNPFYIQFLRTVMLLAEFARPEENITMVCDEDEETAWNCYRLYKRVKQIHPKVGRRLAAISFADDTYFPALQAADMLSFLCREQAKLQWFGESYEYQDFFRYLTDPRGTSSLQWRVAFKNKKDLQKLEKSLVRKKTEREHGGSTDAKAREKRSGKP